MKKVEKLYISMLICLLFSIFASFAYSKETFLYKPLIADTVPGAAGAGAIGSNNTMKIAGDTSTPGTEARFIALGDSYTIGQSVPDSDRFPAQTVHLLASQNIPVKNPDYIAVTGWTTRNLMYTILEKNPAKNYDIVTLLIGVNDQYQRRNINEYGPRFQQLLNKAVELAGNRKDHVFVLSIPDYSATPFVVPANKQKVRKEINAYNAINKQITLQNKISYIDITPSTRLASSDPSLVAYDDLHPSGKEYKMWANLLAAEIKKVLQ